MLRLIDEGVAVDVTLAENSCGDAENSREVADDGVAVATTVVSLETHNQLPIDVEEAVLIETVVDEPVVSVAMADEVIGVTPVEPPAAVVRLEPTEATVATEATEVQRVLKAKWGRVFENMHLALVFSLSGIAADREQALQYSAVVHGGCGIKEAGWVETCMLRSEELIASMQSRR